MSDAGQLPTIIGDSPAMMALRAEIQRVAALDTPVLVRGEHGTGSGANVVERAVILATRTVVGVDDLRRLVG